MYGKDTSYSLIANSRLAENKSAFDISPPKKACLTKEPEDPTR